MSSDEAGLLPRLSRHAQKLEAAEALDEMGRDGTEALEEPDQGIFSCSMTGRVKIL